MHDDDDDDDQCINQVKVPTLSVQPVTVSPKEGDGEETKKVFLLHL